MHGSSELFADFVSALPTSFETHVLSYPNDIPPLKLELLDLIRFFVPASEPFVLLAESFSTPLSIQFAAANPPNLKGLILCAGFATSPLRGITRILWAVIWHLCSPSYPPESPEPSWSPDRTLRIQSSAASAVPSILCVPPSLVDRVRFVLTCDALDDLRRINSASPLHAGCSRSSGKSGMFGRNAPCEARNGSRGSQWRAHFASAHAAAVGRSRRKFCSPIIMKLVAHQWPTTSPKP